MSGDQDEQQKATKESQIETGKGVVHFPNRNALEDSLRREFQARCRAAKKDPSGNPAFGR